MYTYLGIDAYQLWTNELELKTSIQGSLAAHVFLRHKKSQGQASAYQEGEKSIFLCDYTTQDIEDTIVKAITELTYSPIKMECPKCGTWDYAIIKMYATIPFCCEYDILQLLE